MPTVPRASRRTPVRCGGHKARSITTLSHQREVSLPSNPCHRGGVPGALVDECRAMIMNLDRQEVHSRDLARATHERLAPVVRRSPAGCGLTAGDPDGFGTGGRVFVRRQLDVSLGDKIKFKLGHLSNF